MKIYLLLIIGFILITQPTLIFGQGEDWFKFVALETSRSEVEKVLGEPEIYFETSGTYKTEKGKFIVWYSEGGCNKNKGLQYNIAAQKMIQFVVYVKGRLPLKEYISDIATYKKTVSPFTNNRFWYISSNGSIMYETIVFDESEEFVYSISIVPSKDKQQFLCNETNYLQ